MNNNISYVALGLSLLAIVVSGTVAITGQNVQLKFGASCSGVNSATGCTAFNDLRTDNETVSSTLQADKVNASTSMSINGGTAIKKIGCATSAQTIASIGPTVGATTSFDIALSGQSTSANQVYSVGYATATLASIILQPRTTSTAGFLNILVSNTSGTSPAITTTTFSACFMQF